MWSVLATNMTIVVPPLLVELAWRIPIAIAICVPLPNRSRAD